MTASPLAEAGAVERCPTGAIVWLTGAQFARVPARQESRQHEDLWTKNKPAPAEPHGPAVPRNAPGARRSGAVVAMETAAGEAAGAYPITPSTQMGEGWAAAVAEGKRERQRPPAAVLRARRRARGGGGHGRHVACPAFAPTNFSSGQGIAYMHESLYAAVGKRLTYVLNVAARAMTKHALNVHAGHDDYHAVDDTGFFQLFAKDVQEAADLNLIAHRIAELSLNPGICAQDGFLTSHVIESLQLPEPRARQGVPRRSRPTASSRRRPRSAWCSASTRRRIPEMFDLDYPAMLGVVQNQESYAQGVAAQRPFYFDHIAALDRRARSTSTRRSPDAATRVSAAIGSRTRSG